MTATVGQSNSTLLRGPVLPLAICRSKHGCCRKSESRLKLRKIIPVLNRNPKMSRKQSKQNWCSNLNGSWSSNGSDVMKKPDSCIASCAKTRSWLPVQKKKKKKKKTLLCACVCAFEFSVGGEKTP